MTFLLVCYLLQGQALRDKKKFKPPPTRRYMGITMLTLTDDILTELRQRSHTVPVEVKSGVLIWKVIVGSPAYKCVLLIEVIHFYQFNIANCSIVSNKTANFVGICSGGLSPGDIVTHINGKEIHNTSDIYSFLSQNGIDLKMTIYRGAKKLEVRIVPEDIDE